MFPSVQSFRRSSFIARSATFTAVLASFAILAPAGAQTSTKPQLLPYMTRLIAGNGTTAHVAASACAPAAGAAGSGLTAYDAWGSGCLGSEVGLLAPKSLITDATGAIYFTDYTTAANGDLTANSGVVQRLDPVTGVVTTIAGGGAAIAAGASCGTADANNSLAGDVFGDGCLATSVHLERPTGLALSNDGKTLYIVDNYSYNVRSVSLNSGGVSAAAIVNGGSGYATAPTVTFSAAPSGGVTATGTATINSSGVVTGVTITKSGSGYITTPTVTFSVPGTGTNAATGQAVFAGKIAMAVGSNNGTSASAAGFSVQTGCTLSATATAGAVTACTLRSVYGIAVDSNGLLYLPEEYFEALLVANPTTTTQTVLGTSVPAGSMQFVAGYRSGGCVNGNLSASGCAYGVYVNGSTALSSGTQFDNPYNVAIDSYGNSYITDYYYGNIAQLSAGTNLINGATPGYIAGALSSTIPANGIINSYAGSPAAAASHTYATPAATTRGIAATFNIGADYGVGIDPTNNLYITDTTNSYVWRVDAATQTMFVVAGGGNANANYTVGAACAGTPSNVTATASDIFGDGCPATSAVLGVATAGKVAANLFKPYADAASNLYIPDTTSLLYREAATGANFGNTGSTATDYLDIHFQKGDAPAATTPYVITTGSAIFTVGTAVCTTNTDANANFGNSTDCILPITANPAATGAYSGVLTVTSKNNGAVTFPLSGFYAQSPVTSTSVSYTVNQGGSCGSTTYSTSTSFALSARLVANGSSVPTGTIQFFANGTSLGSPQTVTNIGTTAAPVYGATYAATFASSGNHSITATYTPTTGSYYVGSTSGATVFATAPAALSFVQTPNQLTSVTAGGTALYAFTLTSTLYSGAITFSCTGLPAGASCVFNPSSITATGCSATSTVALSIFTTAPLLSTPAGLGGSRTPWGLFGMIAGLLLAAFVGVFRRRLPMRAGQLLMVVALLLGTSGIVACSKAAGTVLAPGTPSGNYTPTVTATGADGTTNSITVSLTVR